MFGYNVKEVTDAMTTISSLSGATTIAPSAGADIVFVQANTQNVRIDPTGTTPTATVGMRLAAGSFVPIGVGYGVTIKVIEEAASASVNWYSISVKRDANT